MPFLLLDIFLLVFILKDFIMSYFVLFSSFLFSCCNKIATENWSKLSVIKNMALPPDLKMYPQC